METRSVEVPCAAPSAARARGASALRASSEASPRIHDLGWTLCTLHLNHTIVYVIKSRLENPFKFLYILQNTYFYEERVQLFFAEETTYVTGFNIVTQIIRDCINLGEHGLEQSIKSERSP